MMTIELKVGEHLLQDFCIRMHVFKHHMLSALFALSEHFNTFNSNILEAKQIHKLIYYHSMNIKLYLEICF